MFRLINFCSILCLIINVDHLFEQSVLTLKTVEAKDTGRFLCKAKNEVGESSKNFSLIVNRKLLKLEVILQ